MAEGVVSEIAVKLLEVLVSHVGQEIKSTFGVKDEIEKLTDTVSTIKDVLVGAENTPVSELLRRLKDALYDADDLLDDFATQLKQREVMTGSNFSKEVRIFFSSSNQIAYSLKMSRKIKAVREKLENIKDYKEFYDLRTSVGERVHNNTSERVETHCCLPELVIGRDDDKKKVIKLLLESNDDENVSFIPIVGMGGLGKTTLAKLVYNNEEVTRHFQLKMWVCVSDKFHVEVIVENIIESATNRKHENLPMEQLQKLLHELIGKKKYLLVLDDIWNEDPREWTQLKDLLIHGIRGSKILITTRSQMAAKVINKHLSYNLEGLDKKKSWSLFTQKAFEHGIVPEDSKHLVKIGKEIVEKCKGIPLSISTIGSCLNGNITKNYWSNIRDNEMFEISEKEGGILPILRLSYDNLPSHLKQCFAYCALFPKNFKIESQKLISLWMAQGFIQSSEKDQCAKDVGNKYFMYLLMKSFFQDPEYDHHGNLISCKIHDLMRDLAQLVAGVECTMATLETNNHSIDERCRHLSLDCSRASALEKFPNALPGVEQIRTLILFVESYHDYQWNDHHKIFSSYTHLRALDFSKIQFKKLSSSIYKLRLLRYLNLSKNYEIKNLPDSILMLKNLETLDLTDCRSLEELPRKIKKMVSLKHLMVEGCWSLIRKPPNRLTPRRGAILPPKRGAILPPKREAILQSSGLKKSAEKNGKKSAEKNGKKSALKKLKDVDDAKLVNYKEVIKFFQSLDSERNERHELVLEDLKSPPNLKEIKVEDFTVVESFITNLTSIRLSNCMRHQHLPRLDQLPFLKSLYLRGLNDLEYVLDQASDNCYSTTSETFFPSLGDLKLLECPKLKEWWRKGDEERMQMKEMSSLPSFHCLSELFVEGCPKLTSMPLYPSVEKLKLVNTSSRLLQHSIMLTDRAGPSTSSSFSAPISKLKSLLIKNATDLESVDSFVDLTILPCKTLSRLRRGIGNLTSLEQLEIESCHNFGIDEKDDDTQWQHLASLKFVKFYWLQKLKSLPKGLQHVKSLEILKIEECPNLTALPEWIGKLNLKQLWISDCPYLSETCGNQWRQDWKKIEKIPNIIVDSQWIRSEGKYLLNKESSSEASTFSPSLVLQDSQRAERISSDHAMTA